MKDYELMQMALGTIAMAYGIVLLICIAFYAVTSLVYMKIFKTFESCNPIYAWIPYVQNYQFGKVAWQNSGSIEPFFGKKRITNEKLAWYWIVYILWSFIPIVGSFIYMYKTFNAYLTIVRFIYSRMTGDDGKLMPILTLFFPFILWIKVFTASGELQSEADDMFGYIPATAYTYGATGNSTGYMASQSTAGPTTQQTNQPYNYGQNNLGNQ